MTVDIDLKADPEPAAFFEGLAALKNEMNVNLELASPDQFIPELPAWRERSLFIARSGRLDFFHMDPYSQALAKLERKHARDLMDVQFMRKKNLIEPGQLWDLFEKIESQLIRFPAIESKAFRRSVQEFCFPESS